MQAAVKIPVGKKNSNSPIEIDHVRIGHAGRKAEIAGAFDSASRVIRISKFDSGIDLLSLAREMMPGCRREFVRGKHQRRLASQWCGRDPDGSP